MNLKALQTELQLPEYTGSDDDKRQHYNAKMVEISVRVPLVDLQLYLAKEGIIFKLQATALSGAEPSKTAAQRILYLFSPEYLPNDVDVSAQSIVDGLAVLSVDIDAAQATAITDMGADTVHVSATIQGLPRYLLTRQVTKALGGA